MNLKKWFNKKLSTFVIATSNVEKDMLNQKSEETEGNIGKYQKIGQGTLMDNLIKGEVTQEVEDLRWRNYKVLKNTEGLTTEIDGELIKVKVKNNYKGMLRKIKTDDFDDYPLEISFNNNPITLSTYDVIDNGVFDIVTIKGKSEDKSDKDLNTIKKQNHESNNKQIRPLSVFRENTPKFKIEDYTKKINIRSINTKEKLIEFYVSEYPDIYNRKSNLFLSQIKKAMQNPRVCDFLDINYISFLGDKTPGARDLHEYSYKIISFDKIIKFDGHFVIKFKSELKVNGEYLLEKFRSDSLDEKYKNNERKN